ncbi:aldehyde dehydrogenase family protein [bacterium]|nr:aldehyde dehydrogenase family protein [bacterium]
MAQITTHNPATGETLATYDMHTADQVTGILGDVHAAQPAWAARPIEERAGLAGRLASVLRAHKAEWARLMTLEMGKPISESGAEIDKCAWLCDVYAERSAAWLADEPVAADGRDHRVIYQPLGVVLSIMPWNYPFWQALRFGVPTVLAGNASILKHARNVTGCALALEAAFAEAGFPEDVFRTVVADHEATGALLDDLRVAGVSLTGSTEVGRGVAARAAHTLKTCVLELGGSDPFIVLADADLDRAVEGAMTGRLLNTGQSCIAAKRFLVERTVHDEFLERFTAAMRGRTLGDPLDPGVQVGAIVNEKELQNLLDQIEQATAAGARVLCGGERLDRPGTFLPPTVLADVETSMRVWAEEVFGPVAPVIAVPDQETAVELANASEFGLGGSVWTADIARGEAVARQLECGSAFVNSITKSDPRMPFGGVKQSGYGRELAWFGLRAFTNAKGLNVYD